MVKKTTKKYTPNQKEKYMCVKHKKFFTEELIRWKKDIIRANNLGNLLNSSDDSMSSADLVDQASSYTDKSVEMKALNRSRKLIAKIDFLNRKGYPKDQVNIYEDILENVILLGTEW